MTLYTTCPDPQQDSILDILGCGAAGRRSSPNQQQFIHDQHLPFGFKLHKDPSKMNKAEVSGLRKLYWYKRQLNPTVPGTFPIPIIRNTDPTETSPPVVIILLRTGKWERAEDAGKCRRRARGSRRKSSRICFRLRQLRPNLMIRKEINPSGFRKAKGKQHLANSDSKSNSDSHPHRSRAGLEVRKQRGESISV